MRIAFSSYDEVLPLSGLRKSKHQRNVHPKEQIERLALIMREHGVRQPISISRQSGEVCFGHGRWEAARLNGWTEFPVVYQDFDSPEEEYACVQSDNAIAHWAELDLSAINSDIGDLGPDFNLDLLGIEGFKLDAPIEAQADEDEVPEHVEPNAKLGDIYQLGRHRLMCGDSTSIDAVETLMDGAKADMVFTDPPYGMAYKSNSWDSTKADVKARRTDRLIENDETTEVGEDAIRLLPAVLNEQAHLYVWCRWDCFGAFLPIVQSISKVKSVIVWDKGGPGLGDLQCSYGDSEWAIHGLIGRKPLAERQNCVWQVTRMKGLSMVHPTQKPIELCERAIENSTSQKESIIDLFGGSGSTLIACEKTKRSCYMMELDPHYIDVIIARWEKYSGGKAELLNREPDTLETNGPS